MEIAVQMYSLREDVHNIGLSATLELVRDAGFGQVELAGFYDLRPSELKKLLDNYGLSAPSAHIGYDLLCTRFDTVGSFVKKLGIKSVVVPWLAAEQIGNVRVQKKLQSLSARLAKKGVAFAYHNHSQEFAEPDTLIKLTDAVPGIKLQLDIFWAVSAGVDVVEFIKKYADRITQLHIKELSPDGVDADNPVVGDGVSKSAEAVKAAGDIGLVILEFEKVGTDHGTYMAESLKSIKNFAG
ncbi:MAG: sugar phosphate isomerase/epimerase [Clostridiales bacterium]|jgi:sugar phosphate isomerase/epimerase|nr:sugar phosphate isomerase/epimerase [Clostridiales bacterium]